MKKIIFFIIALTAMTGCSGVKNLTPADSKMPEAYMPGLESDSACVADMAFLHFLYLLFLYTFGKSSF